MKQSLSQRLILNSLLLALSFGVVQCGKKDKPPAATAPEAPVSQIVLSDGLATISVFVEPAGMPARPAEAASEEGTTSFFVRPAGDNVVTVLGEVPIAAAQQVGRSVSRRP